MATRAQDLLRVAALVGDQMFVNEVNDGWPSIVVVGGRHQLSLHVGPIGLSHRGRDDVERRFQNPGSGRPLMVAPSTTPLLLGLWEEGERPVLVAADAARRIGLTTRYSVFIPLWLLERAAHVGWAEHTSTSEERLVAFHPALLPTFVELLQGGTQVNDQVVASVLEASGLLDRSATPADERARRATMTLVRSASFSKQVLEAYDGLCAMCGLDLGLCQGAHIYPASAPGAPDHLTNGIALCSNHHVAFDRHLVWVDPEHRRLRLHPSVYAQAITSRPARLFVEGTEASLREPAAGAMRPLAEMFRRRYAHFGDGYSWVD